MSDGVSVALRLATIDLQCRWAEALDARDWDGVRACFTPDVRSELPRTGVSEGVDALLTLQRPVLEGLDLTQHFLTNHRVRSEGDVLLATCSVIARHERQGVAGREAFTFGGRYTDTVVDLDGSLRIARRRLEVVWREGDPSVLA
jgi:3-phenylpropionate/cinnamic acid dioxygenase small subunit